MTRKTFAFAVLLLFLCTITVVPIASALTWTTLVTVTKTTSYDTVGAAGVKLSNDVFLFAWENDATGLDVRRCTVSLQTCTENNIAAADGTATDMDLFALSSTTAWLCQLRGTGNAFVFKTTDGGATWGGGDATSGTDDAVGSGCGVFSDPGGNNVWAVFYDDTVDRPSFVKSTNGGTTWGSLTVLDVTTNADSGSYFRGFATSSTTAVVVYSEDDEQLRRCYTTTGGSAQTDWTCATDTGTANSEQIDLAHVGGVFYFATTSNANNLVKYYTLPSVSGTFSGKTVASGTPGTTTKGPHIAVEEGFISIAWGRRTGTSDVAYYSSSTDSGLTFGNPETPYTITADADNSGIQAFVMHQSNGNVVTAYYHLGTAGTDEYVIKVLSAPSGLSGSGGGGLGGGSGDAATALDDFCDSVGFSSSASKFLCGLVMVAMVMVVLVAATAAFTGKNSPAPLFAGGFGALGMSIFNGVAGIWETWTIVVVIIVAGGFAAVFARRVVGGG